MKKITFIVAAFISAFFLSFNIVNISHQKESAQNSIPDEVFQIFQNSCFDCHSKGGKRMAMSKVNFPEWEKYSQDKKIKKAADIVKMLKKGAMPPKLYRQQHPDRIPTPQQVDLISQWAGSLSSK